MSYPKTLKVLVHVTRLITYAAGPLCTATFTANCYPPAEGPRSFWFPAVDHSTRPGAARDQPPLAEAFQLVPYVRAFGLRLTGVEPVTWLRFAVRLPLLVLLGQVLRSLRT